MRLLMTTVLAAIILSTVSSIVRGQDLENGESQFKKCKACHDVGDNAKNKVGPVLNDIIGRKAASIDGFNYSDDLKGMAEKGFVWSDDNLEKYIENPKAVVPNGKMVFAGIKDDQDRKDVLAYLKKFTKK